MRFSFVRAILMEGTIMIPRTILLSTSFLLFAAAADARGDTLSSLLSGGTLSTGNATFSHFVYPSGQTPAASDINVVASTTPAGASLITFSVTGGTWSAPAASSVIQFDATFSTPITAVGLDFAASAANGGEAQTSETVVDNLNSITYNPIFVLTDGAGPLPDTLSATMPLSQPAMAIHVIKSIDTAASGPDGTATISSVSNSYIPTLAGLPEPATILLMPPALLLLASRRGRRS
jgi:hypothetical protein